MKRHEYLSPRTSRARIEVESAFCGASSEVTNPNEDCGRIGEHSTNTYFGGDFSGLGWDTNPTDNNPTF